MVDDAVRSIPTVKYRLGLFEHPFGNAETLAKVSLAPGHQRVRQRSGRRSCYGTKAGCFR